MIFNTLLAVAVVTGLLWPQPGLAIAPLRRELVIAVMFLMSLTLPAERLRRAAGNIAGLGASFGVGYVALPLVCGVLAGWLYPDDPGPRAGLVVLGALPCTLASATVWTRLAGGDDALALTYTVLSNVLSVALVPLYLLLFLGEALPVPAARLFTDLAIVVLTPVAAGQILRRILGARVDAWKPRIAVIARGLVLTIVLVAVSKMSGEVRAHAATVGSLAALAVVLHLSALGLGMWIAARLGRPRGEHIAIGLAGSQKTLFIGVFLAGEYFPEAPLALLPVTAYHVIQLVIDTAVAGRFARTTREEA